MSYYESQRRSNYCFIVTLKTHCTQPVQHQMLIVLPPSKNSCISVKCLFFCICRVKYFQIRHGRKLTRCRLSEQREKVKWDKKQM